MLQSIPALLRHRQALSAQLPTQPLHATRAYLWDPTAFRMLPKAADGHLKVPHFSMPYAATSGETLMLPPTLSSAAD